MSGELQRATDQKPGTSIARSPTPGDLLQFALNSGADLDRLEKLMDLQQKWEANEARKAYTAAMAEFKLNPPEILKNKQVKFGTTSYSHAELGEVTEAIVAGLAGVGISHRWIPQQDGAKITVTCELTHRMGHSTSISMTGAPDASGQKNPVQQIASTITYFARYSLLLACGLATKAITDDDGRGAGSGRPGQQAVNRNAPKESPERAAMLDQAWTMADQGTEAFRVFYAALTKEQRALIGDRTELHKRCVESDALMQKEPADA